MRAETLAMLELEAADRAKARDAAFSAVQHRAELAEARLAVARLEVSPHRTLLALSQATAHVAALEASAGPPDPRDAELARLRHQLELWEVEIELLRAQRFEAHCLAERLRAAGRAVLEALADDGHAPCCGECNDAHGCGDNLCRVQNNLTALLRTTALAALVKA